MVYEYMRGKEAEFRSVVVRNRGISFLYRKGGGFLSEKIPVFSSSCIYLSNISL